MTLSNHCICLTMRRTSQYCCFCFILLRYNLVSIPPLPLLGPLVLGSRLVKLFLQALVHVLDADFQSLVLDTQDLGRLGSAVDVGSGSNLGPLSRRSDRDIGDLVTGEAVDDVDYEG